MAVFFMTEQRSKLLLLDENAQLTVVCHDCRQVLYETPSINFTTELVAETTSDGHSGAFSKKHRVSIIAGNKEVYFTGE